MAVADSSRQSGAALKMKWEHYPNLRLRPHAPAKGRGRVQRQAVRAFIASGLDVLSTSEVYLWTHVRRSPMPNGLMLRVRRILREFCDPVGRAGTRGRPILWRLRDGESGRR
jgi:hypothetical protein